MFYSNLFNHYGCRGCAMHTGNCECSAIVADDYMTNCDTGEIIDDVRLVLDFDWADDPVPMCEHCAWDVSERCEDDGEYHSDYVYTEDGGNYYSRSYAESGNLYQCEDCGNWFEDEDNLRYVGGGYYCRDCRCYHSIICSYHDHHGEYYPVGGDWSDDLIGFELESDYYGGAETDCAEELNSLFNRRRDVLAFEEDCSLSEGFETISHPHTLEALRDFDFDTLCDVMTSHGACYNPSTAGLHLHFSRSWFGSNSDSQQATAGRLMRAYAENWDMLVSLSNRGDSYSIRDYAREPVIYDECSDEDLYEENCGGWGDRYRAINVQNSNTIEFRLGAGCLDADYIRAWVELHVAMIEAARLGQAFRVNDDYTITIISAGRQAA